MGILKLKITGGQTLVLTGPQETTEIYFDKKAQLSILAPPDVRVTRRRGDLSAEPQKPAGIDKPAKM